MGDKKKKESRIIDMSKKKTTTPRLRASSRTALLTEPADT